MVKIITNLEDGLGMDYAIFGYRALKHVEGLKSGFYHGTVLAYGDNEEIIVYIYKTDKGTIVAKVRKREKDN